MTRLTEPDVQNPSGAAAFALRRVLASMPTPVVDRPAHDTQDPSIDRVRQPTVSPPPRTVPEPPATAGAPTAEPWAGRAHRLVPDSELRRRLDADHRHAEQLVAERDTAARRARQLRAAVDAERGPQVTALETHLDRLRTQAARAADVERLQSAWQTTVDTARHAAEHRAAAEYERDTLGRRARSRRRDLDARIAELQAIEDQAERESSDLAARAAHLQRQLDDDGEEGDRSRIQRRATAAERDYPHARDLAQRRDLAAADAADRHLIQLTDQQRHLDEQIADVSAELELREHMPAEVRGIEETERAATQLAAQIHDRNLAAPSLEPDTAEIDVVAGSELTVDPVELSPDNTPEP